MMSFVFSTNMSPANYLYPQRPVEGMIRSIQISVSYNESWSLEQMDGFVSVFEDADFWDVSHPYLPPKEDGGSHILHCYKVPWASCGAWTPAWAIGEMKIVDIDEAGMDGIVVHHGRILDGWHGWTLADAQYELNDFIPWERRDA